MAIGQAMPRRSVIRPSAIVEKASVHIIRVYGNEAAARSTPKSRWACGMTTMIAHMPAPTKVEVRSAKPSREKL
jgi:hypothetical protein